MSENLGTTAVPDLELHSARKHLLITSVCCGLTHLAFTTTTEVADGSSER